MFTLVGCVRPFKETAGSSGSGRRSAITDLAGVDLKSEGGESAVLVVGCADGRVAAMRVSDNLEISVDLGMNLEGSADTHTAAVNAVSVSSDARIMASVSDDCSLCIFDVEKEHLLMQLNRDDSSAAKRTSSAMDATLSTEAASMMAEQKQRETQGMLNKQQRMRRMNLCEFAIINEHSRMCQYLSTSRGLSTQSPMTPAIFQDSSTQRSPCSMTSSSSRILPFGGSSVRPHEWCAIRGGVQGSLLLGHRPHCALTSVDIAPVSHNLVVSGSMDSSLAVWDTRSGAVLDRLFAHSECVTSVGFSHDSSLLCSASSDGLCRIFDMQYSRLCLQTISARNSEAILSARFTPNSKLIALKTEDWIHLRKLDSGKTVKSYARKGPSKERAFCVNGFRFAFPDCIVDCNTYSPTLSVFDVHSRELVQCLTASTDPSQRMLCAECSLAGRLICAPLSDSLHIWNKDEKAL